MVYKRKHHGIEQYIIDSIDTELKTNWSRLRFLHETFYLEYGWNVERQGQFKALKEWLQGLPSVLNIAFCNYEIVDLYKKWRNVEELTPAQEDDAINNYWDSMAMRIASLWKQYNIGD
jgi:hypothetical protein